MTPLFILSDLYTVVSLHTTKGTDPCMISYYASHYYYAIHNTMHWMIYLGYYNKAPFCIIPFYKSYTLFKPYKSLPAYKSDYKSLPAYNTTLFSCPTRNRVFNIMSNPASSMFLQKATSSEHISTSSNPSFPRIR